MITIVGCGPGARRCLTLEALEEAVRAEVLIGSARLLALFPEAEGERVTVRGSIAEVEAAIVARQGRRVAVLVSGDPGVASLSRLVVRRFGSAACRVIPGVSSVQTAFARLGVEWMGARIVSAHAAAPELPYAAFEDESAIVILLGAAGGAEWAAGLAEHLDWNLFLAERLTLPEEKVEPIAPAALRGLAGEGLRMAILLRADE